MSLSHQLIQERLQSVQRLTHAEQATVDEHLTTCPECRAYAAFHQILLETLPNRNAPPHHSEREIREKIRIVNAKLEKRRWLTRIFRNTLSLAGVTAALVLLLVILIYLPRMIPGRPALAPEATRASAGVPNPTPISTPLSTLLPSGVPDLPFLSTFPLSPGTTWVYTKTGYTQADGDSQKIIQGTSTIEERVADVKTLEPYTFVHIQGNKTMVSADPGWQENGTFGLGNYEYWYVIKNNQVYLSFIQPDPTQIKLAEMRLVYQFPLRVGSEWCPGPEIKGQPIPDIASCGSKSIVTAEKPYLSRLGELKPCFEIHVTSNSGDVISQFCEGVGVVAVKYNHGGTQFGEAQELIGFINGKDGSRLVAETPTVRNVPTQATGGVQRIPAPDDHWTVLYQKQLGQLEIEDEGGKITRVGAADQYQWLIPSSWSPDSRYLLFWLGMNSASIQADGLPLWSIEVSTGKTFQLSKATLLNPTYYSWAPDGQALVFTNGGYRSAQIQKWLSLYNPAIQQVSILVPQEKLVPGAVAWSPDGSTIAFAAIDAALTGPQYADYMSWENPAIAGRRIYLLDPNTGTYQRLNSVEAYQDAPRWGKDGRLYFVQPDQEQARIMVVDPVTGSAQTLSGCQAARLSQAGYYGQVDWNFLIDACPAILPEGVATPTPTQLLLQQTPTVLPLNGPVPYPTPQAEIIPWEQLINQALIQNVSWSQYQGEIQVNEKGLLWPYTFQYPSDWYLTANPNPTHVFIQNIPESQGVPQGDFAKFEILRLKEPPLLESEPPNSQDFRTLTIAGERGVVTVLTQIPGKSRAISAVFQHKGVWFAISGYITLPTESIENLEWYTARLLSMLASFTLEGSS
jgi:hypothetical protein